MKKTKRVREVLKTAEKVIAFLASSEASTLPTKRMRELAESLDQVKDNSESQGVKSDCDKLQSAMKGLLEKDPVDDDDAKEVVASTKTEGAKSKQKQKKKQKNKKK
jgi:hypothetical protein